MGSNSKQIGVITDSDRRLMERVKELVIQAKISEGLLQAHFAAEYNLSPSLTILGDGTIWEEAPESNGSSVE